MDGLFSGALLPDMTFLVEGERVQAHRIILGSRCKYFKDLLSNEQEENVEKEFPISFTTLSAFRATVRYIYTGKVKLRGSGVEGVMAILNLADRLKLPELR